MILPRVLAAACVLLVALGLPVGAQRPAAFVVAHRGASAYAPEHTLAAYRLALAQGADYVEQDLVISRDGVLICLHDPSLERTTDVETVFPDRYTEVAVDGRRVRRWFPETFTLAEIKRLDAGSWFAPQFAGERIPTFQEAIDLVRGRAGLFPELKNPGRLRAAGFDLEEAMAEVLRRNGLVGTTLHGRPAVHLQGFEEDSIRRLAVLLPDVPRSFLLGGADAAARWLSAPGLDEVRRFATGIAPAKGLIAADPHVVQRAHARGLTVVPYTFRLPARLAAATPVAGDPATPPAARAALVAEMRQFVGAYGVDGLFTDNPDLFPR